MFIHREIKIEVSTGGQFIAQVGDVSIQEKTLEGAQQVIDKTLTVLAKARVLNLKVIGILSKDNSYYNHEPKPADKIHHAMLIGIHRNTGDLMFAGVPKDHSFRHILPDTPECLTKLGEYHQAEMESLKQRNHMAKFALKGNSGRIAAERYDVILDALEGSYAVAKYEHTLERS